MVSLRGLPWLGTWLRSILNHHVLPNLRYLDLINTRLSGHLPHVTC